MKLKEKLPEIVLALTSAIFLMTGIWGLDFGVHWDERTRMIGPIVNCLHFRSVLPQFYWYPSFTIDLGLLALLPEAIPLFFSGHRDLFMPALQQVAVGQSFLFRMRILSLVVSGLTLVWTYLWVRSWRKNKWEAVGAAALLGSSWELATHSRWFTVDTFALHFTTLTLMAAWIFLKKPSLQKIFWAGAAAGLSAGSKYNAGLILLPVLYLAATDKRIQQKGRFVLTALGAALLFFFLSTPGALFQTRIFFEGLTYQQQVYGSGHSAFTVPRGIPHLGLMLSYLATTAGSPFFPFALGIALLAVIGLIDLIATDKRTATAFLIFPLLQLLLLSVQRLMVVRNILGLLPFGAVLAVRGISRILDQENRSRGFAWGLIGLLSGGILCNEVWLVYAAQTVAHRRTLSWKSQLMEELRDIKPPVLLSANVTTDLEKEMTDFKFEKIDNWPETGVAIFYDTDVKNETDWTALTNRWEPRLKIIGPLEVNYNYYPTWAGDRRFVIVPVKLAQRMPAFEFPAFILRVEK